MIFVGMTIGFLLALGLVAVLRSVLEGKDVALSATFTVLVVLLAVVLIGYVIKVTR